MQEQKHNIYLNDETSSLSEALKGKAAIIDVYKLKGSGCFVSLKIKEPKMLFTFIVVEIEVYGDYSLYIRPISYALTKEEESEVKIKPDEFYRQDTFNIEDLDDATAYWLQYAFTIINPEDNVLFPVLIPIKSNIGFWSATCEINFAKDKKKEIEEAAQELLLNQ